jgi:beta-lactamase class A
MPRFREIRGLLAGVLATALTVLPVGSGAIPYTDQVEDDFAQAAVLDSALEDRLRTFLSTQPGRYSVSVQELGGQERGVAISARLRTEPASTIKLFYAWLALRQVDRGVLSLGTVLPSGFTLHTCLKLMISVSDNYCSIDIREKLGNRWVNQQLAAQGYPDSFLQLDSRGEYLGKRTSTADLNRLLYRIESGTALSATSTTFLHSLLLAQIWRARISSGVDVAAVVESKSGQLKIDTGMVEADVAIVRGPTTSYVVSVIGSYNAKKFVIQRLSRLIYEHFEGPLVTLASYPLEQYVTYRPTTVTDSATATRGLVVPAGTRVEVIASIRSRMYAKVAGRTGWVPFAALRLRPEYRW